MSKKTEPKIEVGQEVIVFYKFDWNPVPMPKGKGVITEVKATHFKTLHYDKLMCNKFTLCWSLKDLKCLGETVMSGGEKEYGLQAFTERRYRYVSEKYLDSIRRNDLARQINFQALLKLPKKDFDSLVAKLKKLKAIK